MTPDFAKALARYTLTDNEIATTRRVIAAIPAGKESYSPDPRSMNAHDLAWHIATADLFFDGGYGYPIPTIDRRKHRRLWTRASPKVSTTSKIIHANSRPETSPELVRALATAVHRRNKLTMVCIRSAQDAMEAIEAGADGLAHLP